MEHLAVLQRNGHASKEQGSQDLLNRAEGKFYTHELIGKHLADVITAVYLGGQCPGTVSIIDPFCGDGRLLVWLLDALRRRASALPRYYHIHAWDVDTCAVAACETNVRDCMTRLGITAEVRFEQRDSFTVDQLELGQHDLVITNPPWDILKPDSRELRVLSGGVTSDYVDGLRATARSLAERYRRSVPSVRFSGWGVNLARCGTELALRLAKPGGVAGIVSPASLMGDQVSTDLRRWIFGNYTLHDMAYFPAEARLFRGVDQPCITLVASCVERDISIPELTVYNHLREPISRLTIPLDRQYLETTQFAVPLQLTARQHEVLVQCRGFRTVAEWEYDGLVGLGREIDETGYRSFLSDQGQNLFVKGRMIGRYAVLEQPTKYVSQKGPRIPGSVKRPRVAWRDVARPTQKRRIQAMLIPPGWVAGNSLNIMYSKNDDAVLLTAILAVMNSLVFEFQIRAYLATAHVSLGAVRRAYLPDMSDKPLVSALACVGAAVLREPRRASPAAESVVAQAYGLDRDSFAAILDSFPKLSGDERDDLLADSLWVGHDRGCGWTR